MRRLADSGSRSKTPRWLRTAALVTAGLMVSSLGALVSPPALDRATAAPPENPIFSDMARMETYNAERPVAPGVTLTSFDQYGPDVISGKAGWLQGSLLTADLTGDVRLDRVFPGEVAKREELTTQANRAGAIAAVNASYFDISTTGAPWGVGVQDGEMVQSPHIDDPLGACAECSVVVTEDGMAAVGEILFEGTISLPGGATAPLDAINKPRFQIDDGIMAFTPVWGEATRNRPVEDAEEKIEVVVTDGKVTASSPTPGADRIPDGTFTLVAQGSKSVATLAALAVGDPVSLDYDFRSADDQEIKAAASGRQMLVVDGEPQQPRVTSSDDAPHPRTAVGFSQDGSKVFMLTVDGRQPEFSEGVSLDELAEMMVDLGAYSAVNFDGGGSTTLAARKPGAETVELVNRPSEFDDDEVRPGEFTQRPVPDGLGLFIPEGSGKLNGFWLETAMDPIRSQGPNYAPRLRTDRVFAGLTRAVTAAPHDEMYSAATIPDGGRPEWTAADPQVGAVDQSGVFTAGAPGSTTVRATHGDVAGELELTVLDELARVEPSTPQIDLGTAEDVLPFDVIGSDAQGNTAPIEPADVELSYDASTLQVTVEDNRFQVTAEPFEGTQTVEITVGEETTSLAVTSVPDVEVEEVVVEDFETTDNWDLWTMRGTGTWASTPDGVAGAAGKLGYDFTQSTETRGIGIWPADGFFPLEGKPTELRLKVNSDPIGLRARMEIMDARGTLQTVEPGFVEGAGWQEISYQVPEGVLYPIKLRRIYFNEIRPSATYQGTTLLDELVAVRPVYVQPEQERPVPDPIVDSSSGAWQFGVVSDVGVTADDPDGPATQEARRLLGEARDQGADMMIINSGFVADGTADNFALAKRILDDELGDISYHYVPGPAELSADGTLSDFEVTFGAAQHVVDHRGVRFLMMDTAKGSYKASDWTQLPLLDDELSKAADAARVTSVVVVQSQPLRDEVPPAAAQVDDPKEAATIEQWLSEFEEKSGKRALFIGAGEPTFGVQRVGGVPQLTNGAGSVEKASAAPYGGFAGWSLVHVGRRTGEEGFGVTFTPRVDEVTLAGPKTIKVGAQENVAASIRQGDAVRTVAYPMSASWNGLTDIYIGTAEEAAEQKRPYLAAFDPATGNLSALAEGTITLRVTVADQTAETTIELTK